MATYSLGYDDAEIARLEGQAQLIREPTRVLLEASGIAPGMRVLDLGTGLGHVAAAVAEMVGPDGQVVGVDVDSRMLELARARTEHLPHVQLVEADVTRWRGSEPFDAVVGRLILFHLQDPVGVLRHHLESVRPGGRVVMLDYDIGGLRTEPGDPFTTRMAALVIRGPVVRWEHDRAAALADIDRLARHYGGDGFGDPDAKRVSAWIRVDSWHGWALD